MVTILDISNTCTSMIQSSKNQVSAQINKLKTENTATEEKVSEIVNAIFKNLEIEINNKFGNDCSKNPDLDKIKNMCLANAKRQLNVIATLSLRGNGTRDRGNGINRIHS